MFCLVRRVVKWAVRWVARWGPLDGSLSGLFATGRVREKSMTSYKGKLQSYKVEWGLPTHVGGLVKVFDWVNMS